MRTIPLFLNRYKGIYKSETRNVPGLITQDSFRKFIITEIRYRFCCLSFSIGHVLPPFIEDLSRKA